GATAQKVVEVTWGGRSESKGWRSETSEQALLCARISMIPWHRNWHGRLSRRGRVRATRMDAILSGRASTRSLLVLLVRARAQPFGGIIGPEIRSGRPMQLYGCDPKMSEFAGPVESVFESVAFDPEPIAEMLQTVRDLMKERRGRGRDFSQSAENPLIVLAIDELPSLYGGMERKTATAAANNLDEILRQGRSLGVIVVSATQEVTKEIVSARNSYGWRIAL